MSDSEYNTPESVSPERKTDNEIGSQVRTSEKQHERQEHAKPFSLPREIIFIAVVCNAQLLTQAGLGQAIAPLHYIGNTFGLKETAPETAWFAAAYSLTVGTFILPAGRLGDIFGYRRMFIVGWSWYALWSLLAGLSIFTDQKFFDICRAFQGIGPAILLPNALAILGRTYPHGTRKDMVFSIFGATAPGGFLIGAVFASIFAQFANWGWAFWALTIYCVLLAGLTVLVIPADQKIETMSWEKLDPYGTVTGVTGLILLNLAWNQAAIFGWPQVYTYVLLIVGILILVAFFYVETKVAKPLLAVKSFSSQTLYVLACVAAGWAAFGIWVFYLWNILEVLRGVTPLLACAYYTPIGISGLCAAITTGFLLSRLPPSYIMLCSMTAFTVGSILIATVPVDQNYWFQTFFAIIIMPWGMDMSFPSGTIVLSDAMPPEQQGMAASVINTVVNYSISLSLGIAGTVESNINDHGNDTLKGYRGALYLSVGLAGMGMIVSLLFIFRTRGK